METERSSAAPQPDSASSWMVGWLGWRTSFLVGLASLILGLIVAFRPTQSLAAISVLLGILLLFSGAFHLVAAIDAEGSTRMWKGIAGILLILGGIILLRHLHLTLALIGLIVGCTWVIQGAVTLINALSADRGRGGRGWQILFGAIGLIAGIIVISTPVSSISVLATFLGIWFAVMGVFEMIDAATARRAGRTAVTGRINVPGQRPRESTTSSGSPTVGRKAQG